MLLGRGSHFFHAAARKQMPSWIRMWRLLGAKLNLSMFVRTRGEQETTDLRRRVSQQIADLIAEASASTHNAASTKGPSKDRE